IAHVTAARTRLLGRLPRTRRHDHRRIVVERVDALAQLLAGLEVRHVLFRDVHFLAGLRIAADARRPVIQAEAAEPADLDAMAVEQRVRHRIQDHLHRVLRVLRHQLRVTLCQPRDQFRLRHGDPLHVASGRPGYSGVSEPVLSSLARNSAPRLVLPAALAAFSLRSCFIESLSSAMSFAFTERLIERFLRSTLMIIAVTLSPSFSTLERSSTRSRENSEARR